MRRFASYGGYEYELESGLYHIVYRYYDPEIGRFISIDPEGFGVNWYVYALNDPINSYELFGLETRHAGELYGIEYTSPGLVRSLFIAIDDWIYRWLGIKRTDTTQERFKKAAPKVTKAGLEIYLFAISWRFPNVKIVVPITNPQLPLRLVRFVTGNERYGLRHISGRHAWWTTERNVSWFLEGINLNQIVRMSTEAVQHLTNFYRSKGHWVFERVFDQIIGYDWSGRATRWLRVVVGDDGIVITAYPFYP